MPLTPRAAQAAQAGGCLAALASPVWDSHRTVSPVRMQHAPLPPPPPGSVLSPTRLTKQPPAADAGQLRKAEPAPAAEAPPPTLPASIAAAPVRNPGSSPEAPVWRTGSPYALPPPPLPLGQPAETALDRLSYMFNSGAAQAAAQSLAGAGISISTPPFQQQESVVRAAASTAESSEPPTAPVSEPRHERLASLAVPQLRSPAEVWRVVGARGAVVRDTAELDSNRLAELPQGTDVAVAEIVGRRARIFAPLEGWVSAVAATGDPIVRPPTPPNGQPPAAVAPGVGGESPVPPGATPPGDPPGGEPSPDTPESTEPPSPMFNRHPEVEQGVAVAPTVSAIPVCESAFVPVQDSGPDRSAATDILRVTSGHVPISVDDL
eukprot:TRINITY_DN20475_c0_g1_i1.p1 TRINITY_DN20475_c0_g1~~TRINITY_DN20475_c0_g1_i1.p1  ORF type:complete len:378 (+),score=101.57 TRINITY_DN20475_c0_g1_i1:61-1194(+)